MNQDEEREMRRHFSHECEDCFNFYYPKYAKFTEDGDIEVKTIGFLCPTYHRNKSKQQEMKLPASILHMARDSVAVHAHLCQYMSGNMSAATMMENLVVWFSEENARLQRDLEKARITQQIIVIEKG